jgi:ABC-type nickel/cobalt efflux system permease component RcnA
MKRGPGLGGAIGLLIVVGLVLLVLKWMLITAAILVVPFSAWWIYDRTTTHRRRRIVERRAADAARRRAEVESRAFIDAAGGCGWCGSRIAHVDTAGRSVLPRDWHRDEIEVVLRVDGLRPHAGR